MAVPVVSRSKTAKGRVNLSFCFIGSYAFNATPAYRSRVGCRARLKSKVFSVRCLSLFKSPLSLPHIDTRRNAVEKEGRVTVGVEELALSNSISIVALVELLEEKRLMTREGGLGEGKAD